MARQPSNVAGERVNPRSSFLGFILVALLCIGGILAFLNLGEVVKWVGQPLLILPDLLGIVDQPSRDEVIVFQGLPGGDTEVTLPEAGSYLVYVGFWQGWGDGPWLTINGPNGTYPVSSAYRGARPYDTPHAPGVLRYRFRVDRAGQYGITLSSYDEQPDQIFTYTLVRDYLTGRESAIAAAMGLQVIAVVMVILFLIYRRFLRPDPEKEAADARDMDRRRSALDDFLDHKKSGDDRS